MDKYKGKFKVGQTVYRQRYGMGSFHKGIIKEISVGGLGRDISPQYTFSDSYLDTSRPEPAEISMTVIKSGLGLARYVLGGSAAGTAYQHSYTGDSTRTNPDIKYYNVARDGNAAVLFIFSGCYGVELGKSLDTDSAMEETVTFKCLAKNYTEQFSPDVAASGFGTLP